MSGEREMQLETRILGETVWLPATNYAKRATDLTTAFFNHRIDLKAVGFGSQHDPILPWTWFCSS